MKVKVCGLRNKENIQAVDDLLPDYLGFIFYAKSPRFLQDETVLQIRTKAEKIAVTVDLTKPELLDIHHRTGIQSFQLHGSETPALCQELRAAGFRVIKAVSVSDEASLKRADAYDGVVDLLLFDTASALHGGSGKSFNWQWISTYKGSTSFLLSGGIGPEAVERIKSFSHERFIGIDINSRFESEKAIKNIPLLKKFLHEIRS